MDVFAKEAAAFVLQLDRLNLFGRENYEDFPSEDDRSKVRVLIQMAEFLSVQRTNPLKDFTIPELCVIDVADALLRWCADLSMPRWMQLFEAREELR